MSALITMIRKYHSAAPQTVAGAGWRKGGTRRIHRLDYHSPQFNNPSDLELDSGRILKAAQILLH
jgi:hypothetical protein